MKKTDCPRCKGPCRYSSTRVCRALFVVNEKRRRYRQLQQAAWWKRFVPLDAQACPEFEPVTREDLYMPIDI